MSEYQEDDERIKDKKILDEIKARSYALIAQCALLEDRMKDAEDTIQLITQDFSGYLNHPDVATAIAAVKMAKIAAASGNIDDIQARLTKNPKDKDALLSMANIMILKRDYENAINFALKLLRVDKSFQDEAAKKLLLDIFSVLGPDNELARSGRRRMTSLLLN